MISRIVLTSVLILMLANSSSIIFSINNVHASSQDAIAFDRSTYTWTDVMRFVVVAPEYNLDPNRSDKIGDPGHGSLVVCTKEQCLSMEASETKANSGVFSGSIFLEGDPSIKGAIGVDGQGKNPSGITSVCTPICDGDIGVNLKAERTDEITVSFTGSDNQKTSASAQINWNVGQVHWDKSSYSVGDQATLEVVDPDVAVNHDLKETLEITVSSEGDHKGIPVMLTETLYGNGIFQGTVNFSTTSPSSDNTLYVTSNDKVTASYVDRTLPPPYSPSDLFTVSTTADVSGSSSNESPQQVTNGNSQQTDTLQTSQSTLDYVNYSLQQGEWIKYKMHLDVKSNDLVLQQRLQASMTRLFSNFVGQQVKSLDDIDWMKITITKVSSDQITISNEAQILGQYQNLGDSTLDKSTSIAIPTDVKIGDTFNTPLTSPSFPTKATVTDFKTMSIFGNNVTTIQLSSSGTTGTTNSQINQWVYYDTKTGILLGWVVNVIVDNSGKSARVQLVMFPIEWSESNTSSRPAIIDNTSLFDQKDKGCKDQYGVAFYYDSSLDKCMPPSGSWDTFHQHKTELKCQTQFGSGFTFDTTQNACIPPGGSWSDANISYRNQQCENRFWPGFTFDTTQNACFPPGGSWQDFIQPQVSQTDQSGAVNFSVGGKNFPISFVDKKTGSGISGLTVSFALDPDTHSYGALLVVDPNDNYPLQFNLLRTKSASTTMPSAWNSSPTPSAFALTTTTIPVEKHPGLLRFNDIPFEDVSSYTKTQKSNPEQNSDSGSLITKALFMVLKAANLSGLPLGKWASQLPLLDIGRTPISYAEKQILDDISKKKQDSGWIGDIVNRGSSNKVANEFLDLKSNDLDVKTIAQCKDTGNDRVSWVQFGNSIIYYCDSIDLGDSTGKLKSNPFPDDPNTKVYLQDKNIIGKEIVCTSDELKNGCPAPPGNYTGIIDTPNQDPVYKNDIVIKPNEIADVNLNPLPVAVNNPENNNAQEPIPPNDNLQNNPKLTPIPSNTVATEPLQIQVIGGNCTINQYCDILIATASGGLAPYHFQSDTFRNGAPPFGMTIGIYGHLTGTPTQLGDHTFSVCVVDTTGKYDCKPTTITIIPSNEQNSNETSLKVSRAYMACAINEYCHFDSVTNATGGSPPYHFQAGDDPNAAPPVGMSIGSDGSIFGTPTEAGVHYFDVCAVDATGKSACAKSALRVIENPSQSGLSGTWTGTATGTAKYFGGHTLTCNFQEPITVQFTQNGNDFNGHIDIDFSQLSMTGDAGCRSASIDTFGGGISGTISGSEFSGSTVDNINFNGQFTSNSITGIFKGVPIQETISGEFTLSKTNG